MADLSPSAVANLSRCFNSCVPPGMDLAVTNYLLSQILLEVNAVADVTPQNLVKQATCFNSCIPPGMQLAVANYLLLQIAMGSITPGVGFPQVFNGHGAPAGLQVGQNALLAAVYMDLDSGIMYPWNTGTGVWDTTL